MRGRFDHLAIAANSMQVVNPTTEEVIAELYKCGTAEAEKAIDAALEAFKTYRKTTAATRAGHLMAWREQISQNVDDLATIITMECGKPLKEAKAEIAAGTQSLEWMAAEAQRYARCRRALRRPPCAMLREHMCLQGANLPAAACSKHVTAACRFSAYGRLLQSRPPA
jgi:acyl-CoA reductase-like NAD-dependent aldehyde dehydrogenase